MKRNRPKRNVIIMKKSYASLSMATYQVMQKTIFIFG